MSGKKPIILIIVGVFALIIMIGLFMGSSNQRSAVTPHRQAYDVPDGDTNNEVMRDLIAQNKKLATQNEALSDQVESNRDDFQQFVKNQKKENKAQYQDALSKFKNLLMNTQNSLSNQISAATDGHGNNTGSGDYAVNNGGANAGQSTHIGLVQDVSNNFTPPEEESTNLHHYASGKPILPSDKTPDLTADKKEKVGPIPFLTLPALSTMTHVSMLTSIIAEVPVNGNLLAPAWPFKSVVDRKYMFSANGQPLPDDIAGAVIGGYSVGNMTMSCANMYVTKILFVFKDGHYVVYPSDKDKSDEDDATNVYPKNALGYLSDLYGNTCVSGQYITDAPAVIGTLAGFGAGKGVGAAVAQSQQTFQTGSIQTVSQVTGSLGKYAGGLALAGASQSAEKWYLDHYGGTFDVVFIPSSKDNKSTNFTFNLSRTIKIDFDATGRTLKNENFYKELNAANANLS